MYLQVSNNNKLYHSQVIYAELQTFLHHFTFCISFQVYGNNICSFMKRKN
uniref:Uncharacterized protein n=1 Tax=Arundo donax TaxID=35708 RepID=A0A0A8YS15_ARUDO